MIEKIYKLMNIEIKNRIKIRIPVYQIYKTANLSTREQKKFSSIVESIYLIAEINNTNYNIESYRDDNYKYETIQFLYLKLSSGNEMDYLDNILHNLFPNPIVCCYDFNDTEAYSTSLKRLNLVDRTKIVNESINNTGYNITDEFYKKIIEVWKNKKNINLYQLYANIDDIIYLQALYKTTKKYDYSISIIEIKNIVSKINDLDKSNINLNVEQKKEKNQSKKMILYMQIKKNEEKIENLKKELEV